MKKIINYCLFLSLVAAGTVSAKTEPTINKKGTTDATAATTNAAATTAPSVSDSVIVDGVYDSYANPFNTETIPDDIFSDDVYDDELAAIDVRRADDMITAGTGKNDSDATTSTLEVTSSNARGIVAIKTQCSGRVHFFTKKGKEKGACTVAEGMNMIDMSSLLFPGTYVCRFEGVNGSVAETQLVYKL